MDVTQVYARYETTKRKMEPSGCTSFHGRKIREESLMCANAYKYSPQHVQHQLGPGEGENNDIPMSNKTEETMKFQIWLKGEQVSPEPNTFYPTKELAQWHAAKLELDNPKLGKLEVRESGQKIEGI